MRGLGMSHLLLLINFGGLAHELVCDSMRLFSEKVLPQVNG